jgi:hypothetical protein
MEIIEKFAGFEFTRADKAINYAAQNIKTTKRLIVKSYLVVISNES